MKKEMMIVGLTGQTGAGKSTASAFFQEQGAAVLNADKIAKSVIQGSLSCLTDMVLAFSTEIITPDGQLDRKKLASVVFSDPEKLSKLNDITYPHIVKAIEALIEKARSKGVQMLILDAPTLYEAGLDKRCHKVVAVLAEQWVRRERIMERDNLTQEEAALRISAQKPDEFYRERADCILMNNHDVQLFRLDLMNLYSKLTSLEHPQDDLPKVIGEEPAVEEQDATAQEKLLELLSETRELPLMPDE